MSDNAQQDNAVATNAAPNTTAQQPATDRENSGSSNGATFTQEHMNAEIGKARKVARETAIAEVLKELGLTSKDELKSTIEEFQKRKEADMSEADKAKAELDRERKAREAAELKAQTIEAERRNDRIASALTSTAGKFKANDTDDVLRYARDKHGEELAALIDDSGAIDQKKVDALMEKIKASKPHYFTPPVQPLGSMSNSGGRVAQTNTDAQKRAYQNTQRLIRG